MTHCVLQYDAVDDFIDRRTPYREEHLRLVREAHARGEIVMAGALGDPPDGGLLVFTARRPRSPKSSPAAIRTSSTDSITRWGVRPWNVVVGLSRLPARPAAVAALGRRLFPGPRSARVLLRPPRKYGDLVAPVHIGARAPVSWSTTRPLVRDVLVTNQRNFQKGRGLERAKRLLGEGLLTSEGQTHLRQRRLMQPAFHRERIAVVRRDDDRLRRAACATAGPMATTVDAAQEMMRLTLGIVGKTLFDADVESQAPEVGARADRRHATRSG